MTLTARERAVYFELLEKYTTLGVVSLFLKNLNLPHSATSWAEMREKRLEPLISEDRLTRAQLLQLLNDAEEYGHQNIFLFKCNKNTTLQLINENTMRANLNRLGRIDLLDKPPIVGHSDNFQMTQVRFEQEEGGVRSLILKAVETREFWLKVSETQTATRKVKEYELRSQRAVNVAKLHNDGLLELRIQSYELAADYSVAANDFWALLNPLLPQRSFDDQSVKKVKEWLVDNRAALEKRITYGPLLARSRTGYTMALGVPSSDKSLFQDDAPAESYAAFAKHDASLETTNFTWKKQANGKPSRDIHIRIAGKVNQFNLLVSCERADYERLFQDIEDHYA